MTSPEAGPDHAAGGGGASRLGAGGCLTPVDASNQRRFHAWLAAAMVAYIGATVATHHHESIPVSTAWLLAGACALLTAQAVRRYFLFLRRADELLRKLELEALAVGFAAGAVTCLLLPLLERLGVPAAPGEAETILLAMMASWSLGSWLGMRRYWRGGDD